MDKDMNMENGGESWDLYAAQLGSGPKEMEMQEDDSPLVPREAKDEDSVAGEVAEPVVRKAGTRRPGRKSSLKGSKEKEKADTAGSRVTVYVSDEQLRDLRVVSLAEKRTVSAIVRDVLDEFFSKNRTVVREYRKNLLGV